MFSYGYSRKKIHNYTIVQYTVEGSERLINKRYKFCCDNFLSTLTIFLFKNIFFLASCSSRRYLFFFF